MLDRIKINYIMFLFFSLLVSCQLKDNELKCSYYESGKLKSESVVKDNKNNGKMIEYYENGNIKNISYWKNGLQDSIAKSYSDIGNLTSEGYYKDGKLNGVAVFNTIEGKLEIIGNYKNGLRHGKQTVYFSNGKVSMVKFFLNIKNKEKFMGGVLYNEDGSIKDEIMWVDLKINKDTVSLGENIELELDLKKPEFKNTRFILGKFDDDFNL